MKATPRPLIKWKSFWLGILVLGFLGWAWVRSTWLPDGGYLFFKNWDISASQQTSSIFLRIEHDPIVDPAYSAMARTVYDKGGLEPAPWFPPAWVSYAGSGIDVQIAHWFLILLFLVPWVGFLAWRVRKQRKPIPPAVS